MSAHLIARLIEVAVCAAPFVGVPLIVWRDPAHLHAAEVKRREADRG